MIPTSIQQIQVIDSHTGGEPTRVIVDGTSPLPGASMAEKRANVAGDYDWLRSATVCEPRGHEAMVGAMLCEPVEPDCVAGVIFFNNVGVLNGCLHGTMGIAATLLHQGKIGTGSFRLDTATGVVTVTVEDSGAITVKNVRSYRHAADVEVAVEGYGIVRGDVAWGGNWFFLTDARPEIPVEARNIEALTAYSWAIRQALENQGITGADGGAIDHIEVFGPPADPSLADSKNFVLCPGKAFDRSPCGTGTSAKLACLAATGRLQPGERWRQAGIVDSVFTGSFENHPDGGIVPRVTGSAYVTGEAILLIDPAHPFAFGIPTLL